METSWCKLNSYCILFENCFRETLNQAFDALQPAANFNRRVFALYLIDYVYRQDYLHPPGRGTHFPTF